jgi:hypothetical protein
MKTLLLAFLAACCSISAWAADLLLAQDPALQKGRVETLVARLLPEFTMAEDLLDAESIEWIRQHQPTAKLGYACGHFLDDTHLDCAVLLRKKSEKKQPYSVVVFQDVAADMPKFVEVIRLEGNSRPDLYLDNLPKGEIPVALEDRTAPIPREGFHLLSEGDGSMAFYYSGKRWQRIYTSD